MSVQVEKLEHNMAKLTIEISAEDFEKAMQVSYNKNKSKLQVPGFRKGKVPRQLIEKMYGSEVFYDDALNEAVPKAYEAALEEIEDIEIVSRPLFDAKEIKKGEPVVVTAEVATKPPVELGEYKGIKVSKADTEVTADDVTAEIDKERNRNSRMLDVTDRAVKDGDVITLDFDGSVDGVPFEGGKAEGHPLTIGSGTFIPGFEDQLIGANIDEEVSVNVTFPEEYQEKSLAGKAAVFKCVVRDIKEKELPELNDEFASEVSEFDTLDEYKADVEKNLIDRKASEARKKKETEVVEALVESSVMELPQPMIDTEAETMAREYANRIASQGIPVQKYFEYTGLTWEKLVDQVKPQAEETIKQRLVLEAVAKAENIEVSEEEYQKELDKIAEMYQIAKDEFSKNVGEKEADIIKNDVKMQKAVELLVDNAVEE